MGAVFRFFRSPYRRSSIALDLIEPELQTGDVLLFATTGPDDYLARLGSWHASSQSGFIVRLQPGLEGLRLCHTCLQQGPEFGTTQLTSLSQFFAQSTFDTVIVRKLCVPLTDSQKRRVATFAQACEGETLSRKVTLLMQRTDLPRLCRSVVCLFCAHQMVERLICSELVAKMLLDLELVKGNEREYMPVTSSKVSKTLCDSTLYDTSVIVRSTVA